MVSSVQQHPEDDYDAQRRHCVSALEGMAAKAARLSDVSMDMLGMLHERMQGPRWVQYDDALNTEIVSRSARRAIALEAKLRQDALRLSKPGAAPRARPGQDADDTAGTLGDEMEFLGRPKPEPVSTPIEAPPGPENFAEPAENLLGDWHEKLFDNVVNRLPDSVMAVIRQDLMKVPGGAERLAAADHDEMADAERAAPSCATPSCATPSCATPSGPTPSGPTSTGRTPTRPTPPGSATCAGALPGAAAARGRGPP